MPFSRLLNGSRNIQDVSKDTVNAFLGTSLAERTFQMHGMGTAPLRAYIAALMALLPCNNQGNNCFLVTTLAYSLSITMPSTTTSAHSSRDRKEEWVNALFGPGSSYQVRTTGCSSCNGYPRGAPTATRRPEGFPSRPASSGDRPMGLSESANCAV